MPWIPQTGDSSLVIYDRGCLRSGEEWVERNLIPVAGVTVAVSVLQVAGQPALWPQAAWR